MTSILLTRRTLSTRLRLPALALALLVAQPAIRAVAQGAGSPAATPDRDEDAMAADGLTGPNSYQSPHYGYTIEWSDDWGFEGLPLSPVQTLGDSSDRLYLIRSGAVDRLSFVSVPGDGRSIAQRFADATADLPGNTGIAVSLLAPQVATWVERIVMDDPDAPPSVTVHQIRALDDDAALVIWLASYEDTLAAAFAAAAGVLLDGEAVYTGIPWEVIAEALAAL
jgi:hypothetical protein